jgi:hypothetical protein
MSQDPSSVIRAYFAKLANLIETFNFTRPGKDESMGKDAAHKIAVGIFTRSREEQGGPEGPWPENDPDYTDWKWNKYHVELIGVRTGQMLSLESLLGKVDVAPTTVEIYYGTGQAPTGSMSSSYISQADTSITDIEKAWFFTRMKGSFYELDDKIANDVKQYFSDELSEFIRELNAR